MKPSQSRRMIFFIAAIGYGVVLSQALSFAGETRTLMKDAAQQAASGDFRKAVELYSKVLRKEPGNLDALNGKARVLAWMGEFQEAAALCRTVLSKNPKNIDAT
ncbi:MAG: tetratricopeptide repeat protein, partial [Thermodesulfobacteriota bacterium]